ncbi:glycosyltransferase family 52 [Kluyvera sp. CHPC 1.2972]|uniref:glycosyltransferase family 52 n=1 Tax=Kluyvera sp. CHPC 1.2972 TaxID=2995176 RepID=UPI002FD7F83D
MNNHIFIVCSPLQLKVSLAIKRQYDGDRFHAIYLKTKAGVKPYITSNLARHFDTHCVANMDYDFLNLRKIFSYLEKIVNAGDFIYLANANDLTVQYILSRFNNELYISTFDDGILNINTIVDVNYKNKEKKKLKYLISRVLFKNTFSIKKIIERSTQHFTILDKNRTLNVKGKVIKLDIFEHRIIDSNHAANKVMNVFVGSRFKDILAVKNNQNLSLLTERLYSLNKKFNNLVYLRHPREMADEKFLMQEVYPDSISEDYIYNLAAQGFTVNVVGFASTCQLNVMNLPNVNIILLKTDLIRGDILDSFSLFDKHDSVSIYNLDARE